MRHADYRILTNNPLVRDRLGGTHLVDFRGVRAEDILTEALHLVHEGHSLLSHPLSGSVKPGESPYKSVMLSIAKSGPHPEEERLLAAALDAFLKFRDRRESCDDRLRKDFALIDFSLIESAVCPADLLH